MHGGTLGIQRQKYPMAEAVRHAPFRGLGPTWVAVVDEQTEALVSIEAGQFQVESLSRILGEQLATFLLQCGRPAGRRT
jgi:hypothetical protein